MAGEKASCDLCARYVYDDEYGGFACDVNMDEDEFMRMMQGWMDCPYFQLEDEYKIVRKQN